MSINCLIIEDEPKAMHLLQEYIAQVPYLELCYSASNALDALNYLQRHPIALVFMDINLPGLSGLELASLIKEPTRLIFTTAYSEFAVQSYEHQAVDYLLKPITFTRFLQAVQKARNLLLPAEKRLEKDVTPPSDTFFVKSGKKMVQLHWSDVCYLEGMKEYVTLVSPHSKTIVYKRMKEFEALQPPDFVRVHNSYIVNSNYILKIEDNHVYVLDKSIPIGKKYRDEFLDRLRRKLL